MKKTGIKKPGVLYIGEALISNANGRWSIGKLKKDEAYGYPIILDYGKNGKDNPRICPNVWLNKLEKKTLRNPLSVLIEYCKN